MIIVVKRTDTNEYECRTDDGGPKWEPWKERAINWSSHGLAYSQAEDYRSSGVPAVVVVE